MRDESTAFLVDTFGREAERRRPRAGLKLWPVVAFVAFSAVVFGMMVSGVQLALAVAGPSLIGAGLALAHWLTSRLDRGRDIATPAILCMTGVVVGNLAILAFEVFWSSTPSPSNGGDRPGEAVISTLFTGQFAILAGAILWSVWMQKAHALHRSDGNRKAPWFALPLLLMMSIPSFASIVGAFRTVDAPGRMEMPALAEAWNGLDHRPNARAVRRPRPAIAIPPSGGSGPPGP